MNTVRGLLFPGIVIFLTTLIGVWLSAESRVHAQQPDTAPPRPSIAGAWTLNNDLTDPSSPDRRESDRDSGRSGGYGRNGGRGGYGGGRGGYGRGSGGGGEGEREAAQRMRDATRDVMTPADRLTIVDTGDMIIVTSGDGRVTRLSPDGKKVKDENTNIERRTRWDAGKLVTEINGLGPGKIVETYAADPAAKSRSSARRSG